MLVMPYDGSSVPRVRAISVGKGDRQQPYKEAIQLCQQLTLRRVPCFAHSEAQSANHACTSALSSAKRAYP
jgi:hypothetical protein